MPEQTYHQQWRDQHDATKYPFADRATLTNGEFRILEGMFIDAVLYPIGGGHRMYLSKVAIASDTVTLWVGDTTTQELAYAEVDILSAPDEVELLDMYDRPAGMFVTTSQRIAPFQSWKVGTHEFELNQTEFSARVCIPTPSPGVRGVKLPDGTVLTGDVWLVGGDGVIIREVSGKVRVDVVGDPLFRRNECADTELFDTPNFIKQLTFDDGNQSVVVTPDGFGDVQFTANNDEANDTVLRIHTADNGVTIEAVGKAQGSN